MCHPFTDVYMCGCMHFHITIISGAILLFDNACIHTHMYEINTVCTLVYNTNTGRMRMYNTKTAHVCVCVCVCVCVLPAR